MVSLVFSEHLMQSLDALLAGRILQSKVVSAHSGKVFSLTWRPLGDSRSLLTSCGPDGEMVSS